MWRFDLAKMGFEKAKDWGMLLMVLMAMGDRDAMKKLAVKTGEWYSLGLAYRNEDKLTALDLPSFLTEAELKYNLAFVARLQINDTQGCIDILSKTNRIPQAALFARTYAPRFAFPFFFPFP